MKKTIKWFGVIVFAAIIGFTMMSCDIQEDTTFLVIVNDTNVTRNFYLFINGKIDKNNSTGEERCTLVPGAKATYSSNEGFTYDVNMLWTGLAAQSYFRGSVAAGESLELKFSERPWNFP